MAEPAKKRATYEDVLAAPPRVIAEVVDGELVVQPRPAPRHASALALLGDELGGAFQRRKGGGPGGWVFINEPERHLGHDILVSDMAGWRRETLSKLSDTAYVETPPDCVCEILSPSTEIRDRGVKRNIYAAAGVSYLWLVDSVTQLLEAYQLVAAKWLLQGTSVGNQTVAFSPFDAAPFALGVLWPFDDPIDPATLPEY